MMLSLLAFYAVLFGAVFVWPTWRLWKNHGINGLVFPDTDTAHGFVGRMFKLSIACLFMILIALAFKLDIELLGPIDWLEANAFRWFGFVLLLSSTILITLAQIQMGKSWRIGIDQASQTELVVHGVFAKSRNPIFLGMRINLLGLFLVLPTAVTLSLFLVSEALLAVQVRLEEEHLIGNLRDSYNTYMKKTPRWI